MRKAILFLLTLLVCAGLFAQQPVVAVAPFDVISGISETEVNMITRVFYIRLGNTNQLNLVDRSVVERVMREHEFQGEDWSNRQKTAALNEALNADWIIRSEIEMWGSSILITVAFYDIRTFQFKGGTDLLLINAEEIFDKIDPLINSLIQTIEANPAPVVYKVGDRGPGGGFIFFAENGVYMECSMDIGSYNWDAAITAARNYRGGGFNDWHLPTRGELDLMYRNLKVNGLGGFGNTFYWSSTQSTSTRAYHQYFGGGSQSTYPKSGTYSVRAVRTF